EGVRPHPPRDIPAEVDSIRGVVVPVDAEIDPALRVLLLGLRERGERARCERPYIALIVAGHTIEFVGYEGEGDTVRAIESSKDLEHSAAKRRMARRIGRERRREVECTEIVALRTERRPARVRDRQDIAIALDLAD